MAHLHSSDYPGFGENVRKDFHYSIAIRVENTIHISGQGGWDRQTEAISPDLATEIDQAFENIDVAVKRNGGEGWSQVYKVRVLALSPIMDKAPDVIRNLRRYCPNHQPALTYVGTSELALPGMNVEIEVEAHVPEKK